MKLVLTFVFATIIAVDVQAFTLVSPVRKARIVVNESESECIWLAAVDLTNDVKKITGRALDLVRQAKAQEGDVYISTERNGSWESYTVRENAGVLRISGADERGTMFGVYDFIERYLGVDPMSFWSGVPYPSAETLEWEKVEISQYSPAFKFRGWFINDEDLLTSWRPGSGTRDYSDYPYYHDVVNHDTMRAIVEAAVRLRMNLIIPASLINIKNPAERGLVEICARRGLFVSMHHVEPMGVSGFAFEDRWKKRGEERAYSYFRYRNDVESMWREYAAEWAKFPNVIWQIGLRGKGDRAMWITDPTMPKDDVGRAKLISDALERQCEILDEVGVSRTNRHVTTTLWAEGTYFNERGLLKIPENTTVVFADNNCGWKWQDDLLKGARQPGCGYGVYYHHQLIGMGPHLVSLVPAAKTVEMLRLARENGADEYAVFNVGNVREFSYGVDATAKMTWNIDSFDAEVWTRRWLSRRVASAVDAWHAALRAHYAALELHPVTGIPCFLDGLMQGQCHRLLDRMEDRLAGKPLKPVVGWGDDPFWKSISAMRPELGTTEDTIRRLASQGAAFESAVRLGEAAYAETAEFERPFAKDVLLYPSRLMSDLTDACKAILMADDAYGRGEYSVSRKQLTDAKEHLEHALKIGRDYCHGKWADWYRDCRKVSVRRLYEHVCKVRLKVLHTSTDPKAAKCLPGYAGNESDAGVGLEVCTGNPMHIVRDESERPVFVLSNATERARRLVGCLSLEDVLGNCLRLPISVSLPPLGGGEIVGPWPLPAKGLWMVRGELVDGEGGVCRPVTRFAWIDRQRVTPRLPKSKFRMGFHYHRVRKDFYSKDERLIGDQALVACGAKIVRVGLGRVARGSPVPYSENQWGETDECLGALLSNGLDVVACPVSKWDVDGGQDETIVSRHLMDLAARYGEDVAYYEIGNEWDLGHFFPSGEIKDAIAAQRTFLSSIKKGFPQAVVMPGGWACPGDSRPVRLKGIQEAVMVGCKGLYDVHAIHLHSDYRTFRQRLVERFLELRRKWGVADVPWFADETSCSSVNNREIEVAEFVWSKILLAWAYGSTDYIWYNLKPKEDDPRNSEAGYAVMTSDFHPRAAYVSFAALTSLLNGFDFDQILRSDENHEFYRLKGTREGVPEIVLTAWESAKGESLRSVPVKTDATAVESVDFMGNRLKLPIEGGFVTWMIGRRPGALRLIGATQAEPDPVAIAYTRRIENAILVRTGDRSADFRADTAEFVDCPYDANPSTVDRTWQGPEDCSLLAWIDYEPNVRALCLRVDVMDDRFVPISKQDGKSEEGDRLCLRLSKIGEYGEWKLILGDDGSGLCKMNVAGNPPSCDPNVAHRAVKAEVKRQDGRMTYTPNLSPASLGLGVDPLDGSVRIAISAVDDDGRGTDFCIGLQTPVVMKRLMQKRQN